MRRLLLTALLVGCGGPATEKPAEKASSQTKEVAPATAPKPAAPPGQIVFAEPKVPFTTSYLAGTMSHLVACADSGCEVTFQARIDEVPSKDSRVTFQVPAARSSADEIYAARVTGPEGVFARNPAWKKGAESGGNGAQPWLRKVVAFEDGSGVVGRVMVGEASTGAFLVIERLASAELERSRPAIAGLYANLQVH